MGSVRKRIQQSQQLQTTDEKKTNFYNRVLICLGKYLLVFHTIQKVKRSKKFQKNIL